MPLRRLSCLLRRLQQLFRAAAARVSTDPDEIARVAAPLRVLCENYLALEELCRSPLPRRYPTVYSTGDRPIREAAIEIADAERKRLGLGDGPLVNLRQILDADVGLRVFYLELPARVAGLFFCTERTGGCIAVHRGHPPGRQLWTLAHEYGHFLAHRYESEVTVLARGAYVSEKERFADLFAEVLLMPEIGVRRRFYDLVQSSGRITPAMLLTLSDLYGVSFQAMALRAETLRLLPAGTWDALQKRSFHPQEARALMGLPEREGDSWLPPRYLRLAVQAFDGELLSEGELMTFLSADRLETRSIVQRIREHSELSRDGDPGELVLNLVRGGLLRVRDLPLRQVV